MTDLVTLPAAPASAQQGGGAHLHGAPLSGRAKAAVMVRWLLNQGTDIALEDLPEDLQADLTKAMGAMRLVDRDTLHAVIDEFAQEVDRIGLSFPGGMAGALSALDGKISPHTLDRLRKEAGVRDRGAPWTRLRAMPPDVLLPILEAESTEVAAVLISKLDVPKAAGLLGTLPGTRARQITYAMSKTAVVTPDAVERIGLSLASQLDARPARAFDTDPVERVGAILNSSTSFTRDDVLAGLDESDEGFAKAVRKAIFTFANIPARVAPSDIPRVLRDVSHQDVVRAIAGAPAMGLEDVVDFILSNMSGRMADQLREEAGEIPKPNPAETDTAMAAFVTAIRDMEAAGDLFLLTPDSASP